MNLAYRAVDEAGNDGNIIGEDLVSTIIQNTSGDWLSTVTQIVRTAEENSINQREIIRQLHVARSKHDLAYVSNYWESYASVTGRRVEDVLAEVQRIMEDEDQAVAKMGDFFDKRYFSTETRTSTTGEQTVYYCMLARNHRGGVYNKYYLASRAKSATDTEATEQRFEINPETDYYFQISPDTMVIVCDGGKQYISKLHNFRNDGHMAGLHDSLVTRGQIVRALSKDSVDEAGKEHSQYREALLSAPVSSTTLTTTEAWDPSLIYGRLEGEKSDAYLARMANIIEPSQAAELYKRLADAMPYRHSMQFDVKSLMLVLSYAGKAGVEVIESILKGKISDPDEQQNFLAAFESCEFDPDLAQKIIDIAQNNRNANKVFEHCSRILRLRELMLNDPAKFKTLTIGTGDSSIPDPYLAPAVKKMDKKHFYSLIAKKAAEYLRSSATEGASGTMHDKFDIETILSGAIVKSVSLARDKRDINQKAKDIEEILAGNTTIRTLIGNEALLKDAINMESPDNYPYPEYFNVEDYMAIKGFLEEAYAKTDPGWLGVLTRNIARDLSNPNVTFKLLRQNGKLKGVIKVRPDEDDPDAFYAGTHYVASDLRGSYHVGEFMQELGLAMIPHGKKVVGSVAISNPAMERQIGMHGISTKVIRESDADGESGPLVNGIWNYPGEYASKNTTNYSNAVIKYALNNQHSLDNLPNGTNISAHMVDSSPGATEEFESLMNERFAEGYVMTRIFYERTSEQKPDLQKTYLVFEKEAK